MSEEAKTQDDVGPKGPHPRLGVIICGCGDKIAGLLDTSALRDRTAALPGVVYASSEPYPCSKDGLVRLRQSIEDAGLERVLIAGCTPRLVEKLFRQSAEQAGFNGSLLDVVDIREHCAYVHPGEAQAMFEKAANAIEIGLSRLAVTTPPRRYSGRVVKSAMVVGSGLCGLTVTLALAEAGIDVALAERASVLGDTLHILQDRGPEILAHHINTISTHPRIRTLLNARVTEVTGKAGDYTVHLASAGQRLDLNVGAIVVATGVRPGKLDHGPWFDPVRVVTQLDFARELESAAQAKTRVPVHDIVMILDTNSQLGGPAWQRLTSRAALRQAVQARQLDPGANVTILFRQLCLRGADDPSENLVPLVRQLGIAMFRYHKDHPPVIGQNTVDLYDPLTGDPLRLPYDRVVLAMPLAPADEADELAAMLRVPQDKHGFMIRRRTRLRPGHHTDDGIYVVGPAHQPCDTDEALLQAYLASSRAVRFLTSETVAVEAPIVAIDDTLCSGCGNCAQLCPTAAIHMEKRGDLLSLAQVDWPGCIGCGNCAVACPVKAISLPGWEDATILAQISAALNSPPATPAEGGSQRPGRRILALACEWSAYTAADIAGARRLPYPTDVRIIRMNCSARFDPHHVLWALLNGADGVFLGVCPRGECHYGVGNQYAEERVRALKLQLAAHGLDPRRLHLGFMAPDDGQAFAEAMRTFVHEMSV